MIHNMVLVAKHKTVHIQCSCGWDEHIGNSMTPGEAFNLSFTHGIKSAFEVIIESIKHHQEGRTP